MAPFASMATPGWPDRVEEGVVNFCAPGRSAIERFRYHQLYDARAVGAWRVGVDDDDMISVAGIDGDRNIAAGEPLLADGQGRVLHVGDHADVGGGCDPVPASAHSGEAVRAAIVGAD